ncbi:hypothetical protein FNF29_00045 [Cafeteria roenbergensis]|uniref:Tubulin--tyrosine ligase-like protein 9 n=1 Tax=Cafeteria roenbergensis TaxID=33653 RepID=A0A5A8CXQ2_CAFRO|nr:hypothetical protein FNF29_00045 [Cafeteria roenbergensis]|eukprot:KAA0157469.1 hypothetical protein FNF29_00045 [Cafeteria roenbergensis]
MDNFERRGWICDGSGRTGGRESEYGRAPEVASDFVLYWASMAGVRALYAPGSGVRLRDGQAVNHFPNSAELVRKDMLVKNLKRYRRQLSQAGTPCPEIVPLTFYLPQDYGMLAEAFKRRPSKPWIAKPVGRAQGRGIFLVTRLSQLRQFRGGSTAASRLAASAGAAAASTAGGASSPSARSDASSGAGGGAASAAAFASDMYVLSRYIDRPLLIGGRKFDLRLYCLVTSFSPLRAYIHRQGFARFCAVPYSSSRADLADAAMHLTNVSVQKHTDEYSAVHGGKWGLDRLALYVEATRGRAATAALFRDIREIVRHSLLAVQPRMAPETRAFELYGYDVIIDGALRPWLVEVNASPSLSATTPDDLAMKSAVISDTMDVVVRDLRLLPTKGRQASRGGAAGGKWAAHVCHPSDVTAPPGSPLGGFESLIDESRGFGCGFWSPPSSSESVTAPADA